MVRRKMLLSVVVVGMLSSAAFALAPMGPPMAPLPQGQYAAGLGYAFSDMNLEVSGPLTDLPGGAAVLNDLQVNMYYGALVYGIADDWNVYAALGLAGAEFPGDGAAPDFDGDDKFAYAVGCKRTLAKDEESGTVWGTVFQFAQGSSEDTITTTSSAYGTWGNGAVSIPAPSEASSRRIDAELDWYAIQLAVGPTIPLCEGVCLYGGPFLHLVEADLEVKTSRYEYELEQHVELGGYVGLQAELGDPNVLLGAEFLWTGEAWGFGIGATILIP